MKKVFLILFIVFSLTFTFMHAEEECPKENVITKLESANTTFKAAMPFDLTKIKSSGALSAKRNSRLTVCLSNGEFSLLKMAGNFLVPIKNKGEFILVFTFTNAGSTIKAGEYKPSSTGGTPFLVTADVKVMDKKKGTVISLGVRDGYVRITKLTKEKVCGTFDLKTSPQATIESAVAGAFNVSLGKFSF
ncbi:MAG: hypothetical protein GY765_22455 [bacterium]|nr:hypothetical protein [bacterium]